MPAKGIILTINQKFPFKEAGAIKTIKITKMINTQINLTIKAGTMVINHINRIIVEEIREVDLEVDKVMDMVVETIKINMEIILEETTEGVEVVVGTRSPHITIISNKAIINGPRILEVTIKEMMT